MFTIGHGGEMIKLSKVSKLDGIKGWSLPAKKSCPGSKDAQVCEMCYADEGYWRFPRVVAAMKHNMEDWRREGWEQDMVQAINRMHKPYFRWFNSGDLYHPKLAKKIYYVILRTPKVKHWITTRMTKFPFAEVTSWLLYIQDLPNVVVRHGRDKLDNDVKGSTAAFFDCNSFVATTDNLPDYVYPCPATFNKDNEGKCNGCRACWNKEVPLIAYKAHGQRAKTVVKIHQLAQNA